jgi:hypothetical protein
LSIDAQAPTFEPAFELTFELTFELNQAPKFELENQERGGPGPPRFL